MKERTESLNRMVEVLEENGFYIHEIDYFNTLGPYDAGDYEMEIRVTDEIN